MPSVLVGFIVLLETLAIAVAGVILARRQRPAAAPFGRRLLLIAVLLAAQSAVLLMTGRPVPGLATIAREGTEPTIRLQWLPQFLRAGLLLAAFLLWFGLARDSLKTRARKVVFLLSLPAVAFGGGPLPFFGFLALLWLTNRLGWPEGLRGWRRFVALLLTLPLLILLMMQPMATGTSANPRFGYSTALDPWSPMTPLADSVPKGLAAALRLAGPLERVVRVVLALFTAQLLTLFGRLLLLPVGLRGMNLRRRLTINYFFIRLVPSALSTIILFLVIYLGFGLYKVGQVRSEFDGTLDRALSVASWLSRDGGDPAAARRWLGPDSTIAHVIVRDAGGTRADSGTPQRLLAEPAFAGAGNDSLTGLIEADGGLYLAARVQRPGRATGAMESAARAAGAPATAAEVVVPLDSLYLGRVARRTGVDIRVVGSPNLYIRAGSIQMGADSAWISTKVVAAARFDTGRSRAGITAHRFYLARAFLPAGSWQADLNQSLRGAVQVTLETSVDHLRAGLHGLGFVLVTNAYTIFLIVGIVILIAITESLAVRTGRGIVKALTDEVMNLRDATARIGSGDLDHRIPVHGDDEIGGVARSFNEMAANLKRQQQELLEKERLEADLAVAREIQQRLLPQESPVIPGLDVAGLSIPSKEIGGDLFYFLPLEGGHLGLALGDVAGKSVPAALLMSNVLAVLRAEAPYRADVHLGLARINRLIAEQIEPGRFVTLFYGMIDRAASVIHYASAGHNPSLKVSATGEVSWLDESGVPLGVLPEAAYSMASTSLEPGDVLVIYSDGITEAMGMKPEVAAAVARGERAMPEAGVASPDEMDFFDDDRLVETVLALRNRSASDILAGVVEAVHQFAGSVPQADDMTLVVVKVTGGNGA